jgi:hypothetical protein
MQIGATVSEEENMNVEEVVQPQETVSVEAASTSKEPEKGSQEYNWKEARREMSEAQRRIQELEAALRNQVAQPVNKDELDGVGDDDFLTRKQAEALAIRKAQEMMQEQEIASQEDRMRLKFKDYDDVVTEENVKDLIEDDHDLQETIKSSPNPYATAYKLIKKAAFYQQKGMKRNPDAEKIVKNAQKPISSNAVQNRPLGAANSFAFSSQEEREALYKEMMGYASRR